MPAREELLREIPLFQTMDEQEHAAVAAITEEVRFREGHRLFHEQDRGGRCYVLTSGRIELSVLDEQKQKIVVDVLEPGELCGELSLLDGGNRSATATALEDSEALLIKREDFLAFLRRQPDAALDVLAALAKRIRKTDALLKSRVQNPNELIEQQVTFGQRVADHVATFGGSWGFILMFLGFMALWIFYNASGKSFDPFPFILLNLVLSLLAALQAPVIMMSQNRQDAKDRIRSEADFHVNVKAEAEITELHEKLDRLALEVRRELRKRRNGREG
jgi:CRP/FNR family cyclic AMP-dependent transcriptional regulator